MRGGLARAKARATSTGKGTGRPPPACRCWPPLRGGALRCSQRRPRRETRCARFASSAQTIAASQSYEARCARGPALLRFSAAHRHAGGGRPAPLPALLPTPLHPPSRLANPASSSSIRTPSTLPERQAAAGRGRASRDPMGYGAARRRTRIRATSAAPSSAASGSAREARFVHHSRGECPSGARAASAASFAARPRCEQRREVGAEHRPPRLSPGSACAVGPRRARRGPCGPAWPRPAAACRDRATVERRSLRFKPQSGSARPCETSP